MTEDEMLERIEELESALGYGNRVKKGRRLW